MSHRDDLEEIAIIYFRVFFLHIDQLSF